MSCQAADKECVVARTDAQMQWYELVLYSAAFPTGLTQFDSVAVVHIIAILNLHAEHHANSHMGCPIHKCCHSSQVP